MEGISPDRISVRSGAKSTSVLPRGRHQRSSFSYKEFIRNFMDCEMLIERLGDWFSLLSEGTTSKRHMFDAPFDLTELQNLDYALEGVSFQQLMRMPSALYTSSSDAIEASAYLALEDFLHTCVKGLWDTFWSDHGPMPFSVACLHSPSSKFYSAEKAIATKKVGELGATAILLQHHHQHHLYGKWDQILELALLRPDVCSLSKRHSRQPSLPVLGEALFFALRTLLFRKISKSSSLQKSTCVFVIVADSQHGCVVKLEGDVSQFHFDVNNVYECAANWIVQHSNVRVSPIERIWNRLGNANWGDIGALHLLLASFHSIAQVYGMPNHSVSDLASDHGSRLQNRRTERNLLDAKLDGTDTYRFQQQQQQLVDSSVSGNDLYRLQQCNISTEIVEINEQPIKIKPDDAPLELGSIIWLKDSDWQKEFQITGMEINELPIYTATSAEASGQELFLYVGSHPSQLDPEWEDMNLWYQVQRQTKILNIMKEKGLSSKHLPRIFASGKMMHPGIKPSSSRNYDYPWLGTPVLVTSPVGEPLCNIVREGRFSGEEALKCCHDCLSALSTVATTDMKHGDIRPENMIRVTAGVKHPYYVLIGWGRAILEERDCPILNLHFSSTYALQDGKLCSSSDAESLIYLLYFSLGGDFPILDSVEDALQWRVTSWSKRLIQQKLGEISAVLKAFSDYVDSLCGTPYVIDYSSWIKRLKRTLNEEDRGKEIDTSG